MYDRRTFTDLPSEPSAPSSAPQVVVPISRNTTPRSDSLAMMSIWVRSRWCAAKSSSLSPPSSAER